MTGSGMRTARLVLAVSKASCPLPKHSCLPERTTKMNEQSKEPTAELPVDQIVEALLPHARLARINGRLVKGGRYKRWSALANAKRLIFPIALFAVGIALGIAFGRLIS